MENKIPICKRCHRKLKDPEAIERGYGPICWVKMQADEKPKLFVYCPARGNGKTFIGKMISEMEEDDVGDKEQTH